jgi:hypothetical protein
MVMKCGQAYANCAKLFSTSAETAEDVSAFSPYMHNGFSPNNDEAALEEVWRHHASDCSLDDVKLAHRRSKNRLPALVRS